ncbi:hypothetical protein HN51_035107, partial [Arachis hypogaea]
IIDDHTVLDISKIIEKEKRQREEASNTPSAAGGRGLEAAGTEVCLAARSCAVVEERGVDFRSDKMATGGVEIEGGERGERQGIKF